MIDCFFCSSKLKTKFTYLNHLREIHLENENINKHDVINEIGHIQSLDDLDRVSCEFCQKTYFNIYALKRHQKDKICQKKIFRKEINLENCLEFIRKNKESSECLDPIFETLKEIGYDIIGANSVIHVNDTTRSNIAGRDLNQTNNININLQMNNFGQETNFLTAEFSNDIFDMLAKNLTEDKRRYGGGWRIDYQVFHQVLTKMYKHIHCNRDFPENHNVYVTNKKFHIPFHIYKNGKWVLGFDTDMKSAVHHNVNRLIKLLEILIENNPEEQETLEKIIEAFSYEKNTQLEKLGRRFFMESYQNKDIIDKTYKLTKDNCYDLI